jgi:hypothetical protein
LGGACGPGSLFRLAPSGTRTARPEILPLPHVKTGGLICWDRMMMMMMGFTVWPCHYRISLAFRGGVIIVIVYPFAGLK